MNCRICASRLPDPFAESQMLGRLIKYYTCKACGYVQTEEPTWLEEAYERAINLSDTGIMARNGSNVGLVLATLTLMRKRYATVVDYAGGYGFLVRLLRDKGVNALWSDPYSDNLVARGFEYSRGDKASLVTAFEAFEHFVHPVKEMEKMLAISSNILLTTSLVPSPIPQPSQWWYYGLDHGQHVGLYQLQTLRHLAKRFDLRLITDNHSTHFFSRDKYSALAWRLLSRLGRQLPNVMAAGLVSKTWSDYQSISGV